MLTITELDQYFDQHYENRKSMSKVVAEKEFQFLTDAAALLEFFKEDYIQTQLETETKNLQIIEARYESWKSANPNLISGLVEKEIRAMYRQQFKVAEIGKRIKLLNFILTGEK